MQIVSKNGSERATIDPARIVVLDGKTHVSWQDITIDGYQNMVTSYDAATGVWREPTWLDTGIDNHARSVIIADHAGYLHAILGGHCSPVFWRRSVRPNNSSEWTEPVEITRNGTYPRVVCDESNTLYLALRGSEDGVGCVNFYAKPAEGDWEERNRVVVNGEDYAKFYAGYPMRMATGDPGIVHALIGFYEGNEDVGRGYNQAVCYACSKDGGQSWQKIDGSSIATPARPEALDVLLASSRPRIEPTPPPEMVPAGVLVDSQGQPSVFYLSHHEQPGRIIMATSAEGQWHQQTINEALDEQWPTMRATECVPTMKEDDTICLLVTLTLFNERWIEGKPTRAIGMTETKDDVLCWLTSSDGGKTFSTQSVIEPGQSFNGPAVELPAGANVIPADRMPHILYFDGSRGYPGGKEYYNKPVEEMLAAGDYQTTNVCLL